MDEERFQRLRAELAEASAQITEEGELEELLAYVIGQATEDLTDEFGEPERSDQFGEAEPLERAAAERLVASAEAWASIVSHLTFETYVGPLREVGAMRQRLAGWAKGVTARLTELANLLAGYLVTAMRALRATSFSISVGFPLGVSVGLNWG